jgi:REP element-mobilizing transposase RayT
MFGTLVNGRMALNDAGRMVRDAWTEMPAHYPGVNADAFVVMPDHFHGVVRLVGATPRGCPDGDGLVGATPRGCPDGDGQARGPAPQNGQARGPAPQNGQARGPAPQNGQARGPAPTGDALSLPDVVHRFKTLSTTRYINGVTQHAWPRFDGKLWQRNYYEIIVRTPTALANIRAYIRDNPANADVVRYGEPRFMVGNSDLLNLPKTAFLASRGGAAVAPALKPAPACVISGFLSPMERAMFDACLRASIPMVWVLARGLTSFAVPRIRQALDAGRLLVITPFDAAVTSASARRAAWCNQYVLHAADRVVIGHLTQDGMLACLLADIQDAKPLQVLSRDAKEETCQ